MGRRRYLGPYIGAITVLTGLVIAVSLAAAMRMGSDGLISYALPVLLFIGLGWYGSQRRVLVSASDSWSMGTVAHSATLVFLPFPLAVLTVAVSKLLAEFTLVARGQRRWRAVLVNAGSTILGSAAGGEAFRLLNGHVYLYRSDLTAFEALPSLLALAFFYLLIDELGTVGAITLTSNEKPWSIFIRVSRAAIFSESSLILVGIVFAVLWHASPVLAAFTVLPVLLSLRTFESIARLRRETIEAVLKMAEHIDYRDTGTYEHSQRLADLTRRLATVVGLTAEHVEDIVLTSRVHDLGKIGISNEILMKPGPLTADEAHIMSQHPIIGAEILSSYSMFQHSVDIVRHHHERWDGRGYPDGLAGEQIPLGARILSVADSFDAMTADRPYRKGMSVNQAVDRLKDGMGTQYDPTICAMFINMLIEDEIYIPPEPAPSLHIVKSSRVG